ncbi:DUF192 domain-containing protein [Azoarcus sp. L1K30]|uniref:DUF192 domain-containing protein n=1 Tax=Azoarcus sp. L1K30 TaxID=2820277 RepID=UPI001B81EEB2|nr:DUF192 domain-containing protein [Azoarcus sp. L1K30]MBR0567413.1 DUF192 domain-containing protein [Azoarcus sp. L1K30]
MCHPADASVVGRSGERRFALEVAAGFWARFRGLMLRASPQETVGLLLWRCASVHTGFMRYALDVAYLDQTGRVLHCVSGLEPWRVSFGPRGTLHTLEFKAGDIESLGIGVGDQIAHVVFEARDAR